MSNPDLSPCEAADKGDTVSEDVESLLSKCKIGHSPGSSGDVLTGDDGQHGSKNSSPTVMTMSTDFDDHDTSSIATFEIPSASPSKSSLSDADVSTGTCTAYSNCCWVCRSTDIFLSDSSTDFSSDCWLSSTFSDTSDETSTTSSSESSTSSETSTSSSSESRTSTESSSSSSTDSSTSSETSTSSTSDASGLSSSSTLYNALSSAFQIEHPETSTEPIVYPSVLLSSPNDHLPYTLLGIPYASKADSESTRQVRMAIFAVEDLHDSTSLDDSSSGELDFTSSNASFSSRQSGKSTPLD